jgi:hypothetical protein
MNKISNLFIGKLRQAAAAAAATKHSDKQQIPTTSSKGIVSLYHYTPKKLIMLQHSTDPAVWKYDRIPDPLGLYAMLSARYDFSKTHVEPPNVLDENQNTIHPAEYSDKLIDGSLVFVEVYIKLRVFFYFLLFRHLPVLTIAKAGQSRPASQPEVPIKEMAVAYTSLCSNDSKFFHALNSVTTPRLYPFPNKANTTNPALTFLVPPPLPMSSSKSVNVVSAILICRINPPFLNQQKHLPEVPGETKNRALRKKNSRIQTTTATMTSTCSNL